MRERIGDMPPTPEYVQDFVREGFVAIEDDMLHFCDPVTGERVAPGEVPPSLLEDEKVREGISALRRLAQAGVALEIVYNFHGGRKDFSKLTGEIEDKDYKLVGLEWGSAVDSEWPQDAEAIVFDAMTSSGNGLYVSLTKRWLEERNVAVVPSDINTHMTVGETAQFRPGQGELRDRLTQVLSHATEIEEKPAHERTLDDWAQHKLAWGVYQYSRQYLLLAHFWSMAAHHEDWLERGDKIALVIGNGHLRGMPQKAAQLGVATGEPRVVQQPTTTPLGTVMFEKVMPDGRVSFDDMYELAAYNLQNPDSW